MTSSLLRIVHVASGDLWAGAEVQLYYLARTLHDRDDCELGVVLLNHGTLETRLREAGVEVTVMEETHLTFSQLVVALHNYLKRFRPQVVHSHRYKENLISVLASRGIDTISVRTIHSAAEPLRGLRARTVAIADLFSSRFQRAAVCVSPELVEGVQWRFPALPLEVIENGIDLAELRTCGAAPVDEDNLGGGLRIGLVGRMVPIKRQDLFLATAHDLSRRCEGRFSFHLFGDGPLLPIYRDFIDRHGLTSQVRLMGFQSNMPAWLARMDALVICSDHEGLPMVLLEALALGVPVLAHAVGGMPHVLEMGTYGTLVRRHTPDGYSKALRQFADIPDQAIAKARSAQAHVATHYSIVNIAARYITLYRRLLDIRSPTHHIAYE